MLRTTDGILVVFAKEIIRKNQRQAIYWFVLDSRHDGQNSAVVSCVVIREGKRDTATPERLSRLAQGYLRLYRADTNSNAILQLRRHGVSIDECKLLLEHEPVLFDQIGQVEPTVAVPEDCPVPKPPPKLVLFRLDATCSIHPIRLGHVNAEDDSIEVDDEQHRGVIAAIRDNASPHTALGGDGDCVLLERRGNHEWFACERSQPVVFLTDVDAAEGLSVDRRDELLDHANSLVDTLRTHARLFQRNNNLVQVIPE